MRGAGSGCAGFTLIELMIVVVVIAILAAIAIPNLVAMQYRAKEASVKANMHSVQLAAEDYYVRNERSYADVADSVVALLPGGSARLVNPFLNGTGSGTAYEDIGGFVRPLVTSGVRGIIAYSDSAGETYSIAGHGQYADLSLQVSGGANAQLPPAPAEW
jgi:prepilin-type N-terminal cleavage/methylation domain-containing protein